MTDLERKLSHARPRLSAVSPLTSKICYGFGVMNILIGLTLAFVDTRVREAGGNFALTPQNGFVGLKFWAGLYLILGILKLYALVTNNWEMLRKTMTVAFFTKIVWLLALLILAFHGQFNVAVMTLLWVFLAWTQAWTIIYFVPPVVWDGRGGEADDNR